MTEKTNTHLIKKHGLKEFWHTVSQPVEMPGVKVPVDSEGDAVRGFIQGKTLELGCGAVKTVPDAVGVDIVPKGQLIPGLVKAFSMADIVADVSKPLPIEPESYDTIIARHILEHILDPVECLRDWSKALKKNGRLIIAVPNQDIRNSIPMNYQHVSAYTPKNLEVFMKIQGWKPIASVDPKNDVSFVSVFEKNGCESVYARLD